MTRLSLMLALLPLPALAQDAEEAGKAIRAVARLVDTGDLRGGDLPAARVTAQGCAVTVVTYDVAPEIGVPLRISSTAPADGLDLAAMTAEDGDGRTTVTVPTDRDATLGYALASRDAAVRETFGQRVQGALCDTEGCTARTGSDGLTVPLQGTGADKVDRLREALRTYAENCSVAGAYPIATVPRIADPTYDALAAALTTGSPGQAGSSTLTRGEGCTITYAASDAWGGMAVDGPVEIDVAALDPDSARVSKGPPLNIRYTGREGFYTARVTADASEAERFGTKTGQSCGPDGCTASMSGDRLALTLVGDSTQERATRTIAAMKAFHARCTE